MASKHCPCGYNILIYTADETSPQHLSTTNLRDRALKGEILLCICPQILSEFFAIVTDTKRVKNPRTSKEALREMEKYFYSKSILKIYNGSDIIEKLSTFSDVMRLESRRFSTYSWLPPCFPIMSPVFTPTIQRTSLNLAKSKC